MLAVPDATGTNLPVDEPIDATEVAFEDHDPPGVTSVRVVGILYVPEHTILSRHK